MIVYSGPVFWVLAALGGIAVVVYLIRLMEFRRAQIDYQDFLKGVYNVLESGSDEEALSICDDLSVPAARVVATAIRHRNGSARILRESVDSQGRAEIGRLDRRIAMIALIGQISPALGFLGTIVGFMKIVIAANVQTTISRMALLNGAMEALVVAAAGLFVSIVATAMYGGLRIRLDRTVVELEATASQIVGFLSALKEKELSK